MTIWKRKKAPLDLADHGGGLRRARLARTPEHGTQGASGVEQEISKAGVPGALGTPVSVA
jgi:hypothetical protein